jgi:hypothetical protein
MKLFIYKTLFIFLLIYLLFQLTIGLIVKKIKEEIYNFKSKVNVELIIKKISGELNYAINKDKYLDENDAKLINDFLKKIKNELQNK